MPAAELRKRFNQILENPPFDLKILVLKERDAPPQSGEPPGTKSQFVSYCSQGEEFARAHRYLRPDNSLGGSGRPDPKLLIVDGMRLIPE